MTACLPALNTTLVCGAAGDMNKSPVAHPLCKIVSLCARQLQKISFEDVYIPATPATVRDSIICLPNVVLSSKIMLPLVTLK